MKEGVGWVKNKMYLGSNKGHNIILNGQPSLTLDKVRASSLIKLHPCDFPGIKPKLLISEGDYVKKGQPIYFDKKNPEIMFTAFSSGIVSKIVYGSKRVIRSIELQVADNMDEYDIAHNEIKELKGLEKETIQKILCASGLWPCIRRRPFSKIAIPKIFPKSVFITTESTAPYSPKLKVLLDLISIEELQVGINALCQMTGVPLNMAIPHGDKYPLLNNLTNIALHTFAGPHPSGNVGYHISNIDPIKDKDTNIWYISLEDTVSIGKLFLTGRVDYRKIITVGGSPYKADNRHLVINRGMLISDILSNKSVSSDYRIISGDIFSGEAIEKEHAIGFYHSTVSVIKDVFIREFIGWLKPRINKYSLSHAFISCLFQKKPINISTAMNGGVRTIVPLGLIEKMCNLEILPTMLLKSIIARDIEMMEKLGIYECSPEDFGLCAYADASKMDIMGIVQEGLNYAEMEG